VLRQLHWLPVKQRIDFKLAVLVYKSLHGFAPPYLSENCQLVTEVGRRHHEHSHRSVTGVSQQLDRGYGTACRLRSDEKTLLLNIIGGYLRRICSFSLRRIVTFFA